MKQNQSPHNDVLKNALDKIATENEHEKLQSNLRAKFNLDKKLRKKDVKKALKGQWGEVVETLLGPPVQSIGPRRRYHCPFKNHFDENPSFDYYIRDGKDQGFFCHGCGKSGGDVISLIQHLFEVSFKEALLILVQICGLKLNESSNGTSSVLTVCELAKYCQLPAEWLIKVFGLKNWKGGVICPQLDANGKSVRPRLRTSLKGAKKVIWAGKGSMVPGGLHKFQASDDTAIIVEGESDLWTACFHGISNVLSIPGNSMVKVLQLDHLDEVRNIYVLQEHGQGGKSFVDNMARRLDELEWKGHLYAFKLPVKDLSDLHKHHQEQFLDFYQKALQQAKIVEKSSFKGNTSQRAFSEYSKQSSHIWQPSESLIIEPSYTIDLPLDCLPVPLRDFIQDEIKRKGVPSQMLLPPLLSALACVLGRKVLIAPKRYDHWVEPPVFWGAIIAPPGELKTPVISAVTRYIKEIQDREWTKFENEKPFMLARKAELEEQISFYKKALRTYFEKEKGNVEELRQKLAIAQKELEEMILVPPRLYTQDATIEAFGVLLIQNPNGILWFRDELAGWIRALSRPGHEGDREFCLELWNGQGAYVFDRIKRGPNRIPHMFGCIFGGIQPAKLKRLLANQGTLKEGGDGLLQRFQALIWIDSQRRIRKDFPTNEAVEAQMRKIFEGLWALDLSSREFEQIEDTPVLRFDESAQELFNSWLEDLEDRLCDKSLEESPAFCAHLAKYRGFMPRLALLYHMVNWVDGRTTSSRIPLETAQMAAATVDYLELHARKVYDIELNKGLNAAQKVLELILKGRIYDGMPISELTKEKPINRFQSDDYQSALSILEQRHFVHLEREETNGRPMTRIRVNPELEQDDV